MTIKILQEILEKHKAWVEGKANGKRADIREADLREADLRGVSNIPSIPMTCPDTGSFIGWKKATIENLDGTTADINEVISLYDSNFIYRVNCTVSVDDFCEDRFKECAPGIHFFINRCEAVDYIL